MAPPQVGFYLARVAVGGDCMLQDATVSTAVQLVDTKA